MINSSGGRLIKGSVGSSSWTTTTPSVCSIGGTVAEGKLGDDEIGESYAPGMAMLTGEGEGGKEGTQGRRR